MNCIMNINTNRWNTIRCTCYLPFYNIIGRIFSHSRKKAIGLLQIKADEKILIIGAGTGLDIPYIPEKAKIYATDITPAMVEYIKKQQYKNVKPLIMDGQQLQFPDNSFDKVILHLILAVIPDPERCLREAERVLKPGCLAVVFDKFLQDNRQPAAFRRILNIITSTTFSDINRRLGDLLQVTQLVELQRFKEDFGGAYIISLIQKPK